METDKKSKGKDKTHKLLKAVVAYRPRIKQQRTANMKEVVEFISSRTHFDKGYVEHSLDEFQAALLHFMQGGRAVKLEELGTFSLNVTSDGVFQIKFLPDVKLKKAINNDGWFIGELKNRDMLGKTSEEMAVRWNQDHPDDKIE